MVNPRTVIALYMVIGLVVLLLGLLLIYAANEGLLTVTSTLRLGLLVVGIVCAFIGVHWLVVGAASLRGD